MLTRKLSSKARKIFDTTKTRAINTQQNINASEAGAGGKGGKTGLYFIDLSTVDPRVTDQARCITAHYAKGPISNRRGEHSGVLLIRENTKKGYKAAYPGDTVSLGFPGTLHRGRVGHDIAHTLDTGAHQGVVMRSGWIRKLMPRECFRLQGFTDEQIDRVLAITSDAQAYSPKKLMCATSIRLVAHIDITERFKCPEE